MSEKTKDLPLKELLQDKRVITAIATALLTILAGTSDPVKESVGIPTARSEEQPKSVIKSDEEFKQGQLIILDGTDSKGTHFTWNISPQEIEGEKTYFISESEPLLCHLASYSGEYSISLISSNCNGNDTDKKLIKVKGTTLTPNPPDIPDTPNPPVPPSDNYGLISFTVQVTATVDPEYLSLKTKIAAIINSLLSNSSLSNSDEFAKELHKELTKLFTTEKMLNAWKPWYSQITTKLIDLESQGKFKNYSDYKSAWKEIQEGLSK